MYFVGILSIFVTLPYFTSGFLSNVNEYYYFSTGDNHENITRCAINRIALQWLTEGYEQVSPSTLLCPSNSMVVEKCREIFQIDCGRSFDFAKSAIIQANTAVEQLRFDDDPMHMSSDRIQDGNIEAMILKQSAINVVKESGDFVMARDKIGQVLHIVQDFYSHSNWIEIGNGETNADLSRTMFTIDDNDKHCDDYCEPTDCLSFLVSYGWQEYCKRDNDCLEISRDFKLCGTLWKCDVGTIENQNLTSGYRSGTPSGKCNHGGTIVDANQHIRGINKDTISPALSPHSQLHNESVRLARDASVEVLRDLWDILGRDQFGAFLGLTNSIGSFAVAIDTTKSMGTTLEVVKSTIRIQIAHLNSTNMIPTSYILSPFSDPKVGPLLVTSDVDLFLTTLDKLFPGIYGDGDELPEMVLSGIKAALEYCESNSKLFVFTDAEPKDWYLQNQVAKLAQMKSTEINFIITESSWKFKINNEIDTEIYVKLASTSGGRMVTTSNNDMEQIAIGLISDDFGSDQDLLLFAKVFDGHCLNFYVDDTISSFTLELTTMVGNGDVGNFTMEPSIADMETKMDSKSMKTVVFNVQQAMKHEICFTSFANVTRQVKIIAKASITSKVRLGFYSDVDPVGFVDISNSPVIGDTMAVHIDLTSPVYYYPYVVLLNEYGELIARMIGGKRAQNYPIGPFKSLVKIPEENFRIAYKVEGNSTSSDDLWYFQRVFSQLFTPVPIAIELKSQPNSIQIGKEMELNFEITNRGDSWDIFTVTAVESGDLMKTNGQPTIKILQPKEKFNYKVKVEARSNAKIGSSSIISVSVAGNSTVNGNVATCSLTVMPTSIDLEAPEIVVLDNSQHCPDSGKCDKKNALIYFNISDSMSGLATVSAERDDLESGTYPGTFLVDPFTTGTNSIVGASMELSCCVEKFTMSAIDVAGNVRRIQVRVPTSPDDTTQGDDTWMIVGIVLGSVFGLVLVAFGGFFIYKYFVKRDDDNVDIEIEMRNPIPSSKIPNSPPASLRSSASSSNSTMTPQPVSSISSHSRHSSTSTPSLSNSIPAVPGVPSPRPSPPHSPISSPLSSISSPSTLSSFSNSSDGLDSD